MNGDILNGPKGFVTYDKFFERTRNFVAPLRLDENRKRELVQRLRSLNPSAGDRIRTVGNWLGTVHLREAATLEGGRMYVRYEVSRPLGDGQSDGPYQMLVAWNPDGSAWGYTFIYSSGRNPSVCASMYTARFNRNERTRNMNHTLGFSLVMDPEDSLVVGNDNCRGEFICVTSNRRKVKISWQVFGSPYGFKATRPLSWGDAVCAVRTFEKDGVRGVQRLCEWVVDDGHPLNSQK